MFTAVQPDMGAFVIRYPRGKGSLADWRCPLETVEVGKGRLMREGSDVAFLTLGPLGKVMESVIDEAEKQGVSVAHYDMRFLKPIDTDILRQVGEKFRYIVTLEDGCVTGGLGSAVVEYMSEKGYNPTIKVMGIPDKFIEHGAPEELYRVCGMDKDSVLNAILNFKNL